MSLALGNSSIVLELLNFAKAVLTSNLDDLLFRRFDMATLLRMSQRADDAV